MKNLTCPKCKSIDVLRSTQGSKTYCNSCGLAMPSIAWDARYKSLSRGPIIEVTIEIELKKDADPSVVDKTWLGHNFMHGGCMVVTGHGCDKGIVSAIVTRVQADND